MTPPGTPRANDFGQGPGVANRHEASVATRHSGTTNHRARRRWWAFALLVATYFITIVDFTIVNVALPTIGTSLRFSESDLQWVVTAYSLTLGGFLLLGGRAADLVGRRRILGVGIATFTVASLACGLATSDTFLVVMRGFQGLGAALVLPAALSIVMTMFPEGNERNKALAMWGAAGAMGGSVGLLAGGLLTTYVGWRFVFLFNVPVGAAALLLAPLIVPESRVQRAGRRYDLAGAITITCALTTFVYALSQAPQVGWSSRQTVVLFVAAVGLVVSFLLIEIRVEAPLLPLRLFRLGSVSAADATSLLLGMSFLTFVFVGTLYMQQVLGFSALSTGAAWLTASVTSMACAAFTQRLVARTSPRLVMALGMAFIGGGILWATRIPTEGTYWHDLAGPFFIAGIGTSFTFISTSIGALTGVGEEDGGIASGLLNTAQQVGAAIGIAMASSVSASRFHALLVHGFGPRDALTGGFRAAMWVCGLCALAAIPAALLLNRRSEPPASAPKATSMDATVEDLDSSNDSR